MHRRLCLPCTLVTAFLLLAPAVGAQQVTGRIVDQASGQPMAAVQVSITGTGVGALTQQTGRYLLLNVPLGQHTLTAQRIGYKTQSAQINVGAGATVVQDFSLSEEALGLDEIIVTGTPGGTQRRAIGNAVTAVSAATVTQSVAVSTVQDLLGGRTPGLQFTRMNGNIGTGAPMEIRGVGSLTLNSNPLIFVDGVRVNNNAQVGPSLGDSREVNPLSDFNPQDIESIEIIKGPAAATLYGTEASAGVIQIITKRGTEGKAQFDMSVAVNDNYLRDPETRLGTRWSCKDHFGPPCDDKRGGGLFSYNPYVEANRQIADGAFTYQQERLYVDGLAPSFNLDVRGGTPAVRYFLSGNYDHDQGIIWYNFDKTFRLRANVSTVFSDQFTLDVSTGFVKGKTQFMQQARGDGGEWEDMVWGNGHCIPNLNPGKDNTPYTADDPCTGNRLLGFQEHLPDDVSRIEVTRDYQRFTGSGTLNFTPFAWLKSRAIVGLDMGWDENTSLYPLEVHLPAVYFRTSEGEITLGRPKNSNLSMDLSATATRGFGGLSTSSSVGFQYYDRQDSNFENTGIGFASPLAKTINQTPATRSSITYTFVDNKSVGVYAQEQLGWNDRVFLTGAIRFDDNSAFGANFNFEKYPKLAATWVVSEESFWNFDFVNSLRLRGAWGQAGRQPNAFARVTRYGVVGGPSGTSMLKPVGPGNDDVGPERSTEIELGADLALLDDRISAEFTWFSKKNEDALLEVPLAPSLGSAGNYQRNMGRIDNWGWEATLSTKLYTSNAVAVSLDLTGAHVDNEIKDLGTFAGNNTVRIGWPYPNYTARLVHTRAEFSPTGTVSNAWGEKVAAFCDSGKALGSTAQYGLVQGGAEVPCSQIGQLVQLVGRAFYTHKFSVAPTLALFDNTLSMNALIDGAYGMTNFETNGSGHSYDNSYLSRCECDALFVAADRLGGFVPSNDRALFDASFWKVREVGVRYQLPAMFVERVGADRASLNVSLREVATLWTADSDVAGLAIADPEMGRPTPGQSNYRAMPPLSTVSATLRVSF